MSRTVVMCVYCYYSKLTQHSDHRSVVMQHLSSALPAFVGLLMEHMSNPVMYYITVFTLKGQCTVYKGV